MWTACCPGIQQLELCPYVPCKLANDYTCKLASQCQNLGGTPRVFVCNNNGVARADGTCLCNNNEATGTGWVADPTRFSYQGCYKPISCPRSAIFPYNVCNQVDACNPKSFIVLPKSGGYFDQQFGWFLEQAGLPINNATLLALLDPASANENSMAIQALEQLALDVQFAVDNILACVDVWPTDTPTSTQAMVVPGTPQYAAVVFPYMKPFLQPYVLTPSSIAYAGVANTSFLTDEKIFYFLTSLTQNVRARARRLTLMQVQYLVMNGSSSLNVSFAQNYTVNFIRLHAWVVLAGQILITFPDGQICPKIATVAGTYFTWLGPDGNSIACTSQYIDYVFTQQPAYTTYCTDTQSQTCIGWQNQVCASLGYVTPSAGDFYAG
jgi:hypothetical protein